MEEIINYFNYFIMNYENNLNPIVGKILGLLIFEGKPMSLIEIAKKMKLSKAAISIHIRNLNDLGYCIKMPPRSDRQDFYKVNSNFFEQTLKNKIQVHNLFIEELNRIISKNEKIDTELQERLNLIVENIKIIRDIQSQSIIKIKDTTTVVAENSES